MKAAGCNLARKCCFFCEFPEPIVNVVQQVVLSVQITTFGTADQKAFMQNMKMNGKGEEEKQESIFHSINIYFYTARIKQDEGKFSKGKNWKEYTIIYF